MTEESLKIKRIAEQLKDEYSQMVETYIKQYIEYTGDSITDIQICYNMRYEEDGSISRTIYITRRLI